MTVSTPTPKLIDLDSSLGPITSVHKGSTAPATVLALLSKARRDGIPDRLVKL